ncbi:c-type cytochrome [Hyphobacterium marinum]|uniref:Cytochrome c family protein n=1 Tax=Hyphobacterium marinum TaxID=3116574 RepID=A0ABU7LX04_9PROT|nr:cytochrome c family protein [Hyphobacterium sp. Y6023]MEE2565802.1 cytochrome c family protein [Hyphobacterium sp. Y6023]
MGELFWNKVAGAVIGLVLAVLLIGWVTEILFHTETDTESFSYPVDLAAIQGGENGGDIVEEVYDLGLLLASADASAGERVARRCTSCHTFEAGGGTMQGPNLHGIVGRMAAAVAGFNYSSAMADYGQAWTYENLDHFIANPRAEVPGTAMSFAGIRNDEDRANLLAYLAQITPGAPAFPEPLPAEEDAVTEEGDATEDTGMDDATGEATATDDAVLDAGDTPVIENSEDEPTAVDPTETETTAAPEGDGEE